MSKQYFVSGGFITHHPELIILTFDSVICVTDVVMQVTIIIIIIIIIIVAIYAP
jgi:hypothetical protein